MLSGPPPNRRGPLLAAVAFTVVAAGVAVWALVALVSANGDLTDAEAARSAADDRVAEVRADDDLAFSRARDEAAAAAGEAVAVLNTLDHRELDEGLMAWADVSTGALHEEVTSLTEEARRQLLDARSVTEGRVLATAVRELDARAGTATVLVAIERTQSVQDRPETVQVQRIEASMTRTDQGWKVDDISNVPYAGPGS